MLNFDFEQKRNYSIYLSYAKKKKKDQLLKKNKAYMNKKEITQFIYFLQKRNYSIYLFYTK